MTLEVTSRVEMVIALATEHPFDGRQPIDVAHKAAQAILCDLNGRRGIGQELDQLDDDLRIEITDILAAIVRKVATQN